MALATTQADTRALHAAEQQYQQGVTTAIDMFAAHAALLQAQDALPRTLARVEPDLAALYKALGGGWKTVASRGASRISVEASRSPNPPSA